MDIHLHVSVMQLLITFLGLIPFFFFWRVAAAHYAETPVGQAMSFIF